MKDILFGTVSRVVLGFLGTLGTFFGSRVLFPLGRPVWVGISILLAMVAVITFALLFSCFQTRKNDHRTAEKDRQHESEKSARPQGLLTLRAQWKAGLQFLKRSELKKRGDPLYVLPWFIVMGESGSGKSSLIQNAGVPSFANATQGSSDEISNACAWSFFKKAVVIDLTGRYTSGTLGADAKSEWHTFLDLLFKSRKKESLNGLVLTLPADQLLVKSSEVLRREGQAIRQRIDELMRAVGSKFPVYLLVTKCDLINGMSALARQLTSQGLKQVMGRLHEEPAVPISSFLEKTFFILADRLRNLRLVLAGRPDGESMSEALLLLPETVSRLQTGVEAFLDGVFQENIYQETPLFRGLFFGSAAHRDASDTGRSWFLHDLFDRVLPADRSVFTPTHRAAHWRKKSFGIGVMCWLALATAACGLISYSFLKNLHLLKQIDQDMAQPLVSHSDLESSILALDHMGDTIESFQGSRMNVWVSGFGFHQVSRAEEAIEQNLSDRFRKDVLALVDVDNAASIGALTAFSSNELYAKWIGHLVGRLSLLRAKADGASRQAILDLPEPSIPFLRVIGHEADADIKEKFAHLYVRSVAWSADPSEMNQESASLQTQLQHLLKLKARDPQWVIAWAGSQNSIPTVTLKTYWGGEKPSGNEPAVPGLFSLKGKAMTDSFFKEIDRALGDPAASTELKAEFDRWYRDRAFESWHRFVLSFSSGAKRLSADERKQMASVIASDQGPYLSLLNHVAEEFKPFPVTDLPPWLQQIEQAYELKRDLGEINYLQSVAKAGKVAADPTLAAQAVSQTFSDQSTPGASVFAVAFDAFARFKSSMGEKGIKDPLVLGLISGPVDFLWDLARRQAADQLQSDWESKVLAQATGLSGTQALDVLLAKDGPAIRFSKEQAAPFIQWTSQRGYFAKSLFGGALPFTSEFFTFLNGAVWVSSVNELHVTITALDPETNPEASRIPHITRLTLNGSGKPQVLMSRRLRVLERSFNTVQQVFSWSPSSQDTILEINEGSTTLRKTYPGSYGFLAFLHDFRTGKHVFYPNDFFNESKALASLGVHWIAVHYKLQGAPDFAAPTAAPLKIIQRGDR